MQEVEDKWREWISASRFKKRELEDRLEKLHAFEENKLLFAEFALELNEWLKRCSRGISRCVYVCLFV